MRNLFYSLITFIIAVFFILLGLINIMIPWSGEVRYGLIRFILEDSLAISLFGFAFVIVGLALAIYILLGARRQYYHTKVGRHAVHIDQNVLDQYLNVYWKQLFPKAEIPYQISIRKNKIHLLVDLPHVPLLEQKPLLEKIKQDLQDLLVAKVGYDEEFYLAASFAKS